MVQGRDWEDHPVQMLMDLLPLYGHDQLVSPGSEGEVDDIWNSWLGQGGLPHAVGGWRGLSAGLPLCEASPSGRQGWASPAWRSQGNKRTRAEASGALRPRL